MASTFPSVVTSYTNPLATDKLNSPSHSAIETNQNSGLSALENFIGTLSSVQGTLMYDIRAAGSNGGGHVQTANKGGTGKTSYTKGDLLVATSSSVLGTLAVGTDAQALVADSTQTSGVKWGGVALPLNIQNQTYTYARASVMSASVYGVNLGQAVSVLSDGLGIQVKFPTANTTSVLALSVNATGPTSVAARIKNVDGTNPIVGAIQASMIGELVFDSVSSVFQLENTYVPTYGTDTTKFLRNDGTFSAPAIATTFSIPLSKSSLIGGSPVDYFDTGGMSASAISIGNVTPVAGILKNLVVYPINNQYATTSFNFILRKNGVATTVVVSVLGSISTAQLNLTNQASVVAGDIIDIKASTVLASDSARLDFSASYQIQ